MIDADVHPQPASGHRNSDGEFEAEREWTERSLRTFFESRDRGLRNKIVSRNVWIAEVTARKYANRGEPLEDLVQVAMLGLVKAVERFDPRHSTPFVAFALPTVSGEIKRHFRSSAWSVSVPRRLKEICATVQIAVADLTHELCRAPTIDEIAQHLGITSETVLRAMEAADRMRTLSSDRSDAGQHPLADRYGNDDPEFRRAECSLAVASLLDRLPPRERRLLELRFLHGLTQREIAAQTGMSQVHVSRLLRTALTALQRHLPDGTPD